MDAVAVLLRGNSNELRQKLFADMIACFKAYNIRVLGEMNDAILVANKDWPYGEIWSICDNGGELNIEVINKSDSIQSVAYSHNTCYTDGATLAYWIRVVMDGEAINYNLTWEHLLEDIREVAAAPAMPCSKEPEDDRLDALIRAAERHGIESDNDYEAGDLAEMLGFCWKVMTPAQRDQVFEASVDVVSDWMDVAHTKREGS